MAALPSVLTGCRIGLVISCIVVFLAEMITSTDGLGHLLVRAARNFQTVDMFVPLIAISLLGLLLNAVFNLLRARLLAGFPEAGAGLSSSQRGMIIRTSSPHRSEAAVLCPESTERARSRLRNRT